jgi:rRNA small subunit aminocarboxypropyltransferase
MEPDVLILRDPRESKKKCSLTPLRGLAGIEFIDYRHDRRIDGAGRVLLHTEGELLGPADGDCGLLLLDCSWRRVPRLRSMVDGQVRLRRLPELVTAYPRRSKQFDDPGQGLASVEALYAALVLLGRPRPELLEGYHWGADFLAANPDLR